MVTGRCWLEFSVSACQRVVIFFILAVRVKSVVWVFLKLGVVGCGGVLEAQIKEVSEEVLQQKTTLGYR